MRPRVKVQQFVHTCQQHDPSQCHSHVWVLLHVCLQRAVPSIPSKFETTLHVGQRERNAFGTRTHRFNPSDVCTQYAHLHTHARMEAHTLPSLQNELPGPGNYYKPTTFVKSAETCGSVSKLGYGVGFVSKVGRLGGVCAHKSGAKLSPAAPSMHTDKAVRRAREAASAGSPRSCARTVQCTSVRPQLSMLCLSHPANKALTTAVVVASTNQDLGHQELQHCTHDRPVRKTSTGKRVACANTLVTASSVPSPL